MSPPLIREYDPARDYAAVRALVAALQEVERPMDPALPPGEDMADDYLGWIFGNCAAFEGRVFVAEQDGTLIGFVTALARVMPDEPDEPATPFGYVSELMVADGHRGRGLGSRLLQAATDHVRRHGAMRLRTKALAANGEALAFYAEHGFVNREIELEKIL